MPPSFSDLKNHWAKACILALSDRHIVNGFPDGTFRPDASLTRAEFAVLMSGAFPTAPKVSNAVYFPDVSRTHVSLMPAWRQKSQRFCGGC